MTHQPETGRRTFLKGALAAGVAAPVLGALSGRAEASPVPKDAATYRSAGQRVIFSYPGLTVPGSLLSQIQSGAAGGVIFFGENIDSHDQIAAVVAQLRQAQAQSPVQRPLLLMTDQEGGIVRRLPGVPYQSEKQVGATSKPAAAATRAGRGAGENLASVGMNVNLAPVLDVFYEPDNFIDQYGRSYSHDPAVVTACGQACVRAQQATGVATTAKHFPGLGSATQAQNTDLGPVTLPLTLDQLRSVDEAPYPSAIAAGVKLVMCSWAIYPALDQRYPAGLSRTIVGDELRNRLRFTGVTITDALEAGALENFGDTAQRAVSAARAGMDLILCSARDVSQGQDAARALSDALQSGDLDARQFSAASARVTALRAGLN